jgi:hypothetical protein
MKHTRIFLSVAVLLCATLFFAGCSDDPEPNSGAPQISGISIEAGQTKYYSLSTGEEVPETEANTTDWDIAFTRTRLILTNSGVTATAKGSPGGAQVWYAETTDFDSVTTAQIGAGNAPLSTDTALYVWTGMGAAPTARSTFNVMSYVGYAHGDGSTNSFGSWTPGNPMAGIPHNYAGYPSNGPLTVYEYDADQYYFSEAHEEGGPTFEPNYNVYIIKHADGSGYSKVQFFYEYLAGPPVQDTFVVTYQKL